MSPTPDTASITATAANYPVSLDTLADTASGSSSIKTFRVPATSKSFDKRFPPEIHLAIFERIENAVTSTCLGLTCKSLYEIHWAHCGKVWLGMFVDYGPRQEHSINLGLLLKNWMPSHLAYDFKAGKFTECTILASRIIEWDNEEERIYEKLDDMSEELSDHMSRESELEQQLEEAKDKLFRAEEDLVQALEIMENRGIRR